MACWTEPAEVSVRGPGRGGGGEPHPLEQRPKALPTGVHGDAAAPAAAAGHSRTSRANTRFNNADHARPAERNGGGEPVPATGASLVTSASAP
jgi:hypothetical protein